MKVLVAPQFVMLAGLSLFVFCVFLVCHHLPRGCAVHSVCVESVFVTSEEITSL